MGRTTGTTAGRYDAVRSLTEQLAAPLSAEDQTPQSMPDASPTKWHRAHTTWFFEEFLLAPNLDGYERFDPAFCFLFNSYYEAVGPRHPRPRRGAITRPGIAEVAAYRAHVDAAMGDLLASDPPAEVTDLVTLGLHHEQQHQELLLMDVKHLLSGNALDPVYRETVVDDRPADPLRWIRYDEGLRTIGAAGDDFAYDNELPAHRQWVAAFELASRPVTVGEVRAFVDDGGYRRADLWLSDGWAAVQANGWEAPLYWDDRDGEATTFTLGGRRPLVDGEPACHLSYYEADAIARWSGARLPTEAEWEVAAATAKVDGNLLDLRRCHPAPVADGADDDGPTALFGDVWEWTSSAYLPYPGFRTAPGAVGEYNGKFMVGQQVLRGGCCATPADHIRPTYRNFFPPPARWAFSGLRLARDPEPR